MWRITWDDFRNGLEWLVITPAAGIIVWSIAMLLIRKPLTDDTWTSAAVSTGASLWIAGALYSAALNKGYRRTIDICCWPAAAVTLGTIASILLIEFDKAAVPQWLWSVAQFVEYSGIRRYVVELFVFIGPDQLLVYGIALLLWIGSFVACIAGDITTGRLTNAINSESPKETITFWCMFLIRAGLLFVFSFGAAWVGGSVGNWLFTVWRVKHVESAAHPSDLLTIAQWYWYVGASTAVVLLWVVGYKLSTRDYAARAFSLSGMVSGAAEAASRGKALVIGLFFTIVGAFVLELSLLHLRSSQFDVWDWAWLLIGGPVGAYYLLARGLGPVWSALSWSGNVHQKPLGAARFASRDELKRAGVLQDA